MIHGLSQFLIKESLSGNSSSVSCTCSALHFNGIGRFRTFMLRDKFWLVFVVVFMTWGFGHLSDLTLEANIYMIIRQSKSKLVAQ